MCTTIEPIHYFAFGDSLTAGVGASGTSYACYYRRLAEAVLQRPVQLENFGVVGALTGELLQLLQQNTDIRERVERASMITITAGGNDLIQAAIPYFLDGNTQFLSAALRTYFHNFKQLIQEIKGIKQHNYTNCLIILIGLYNPLPDLPDAIKWVRRFNRYLQRISEEQIQVVTEVFDKFVGRETELLSEDHVHPNRKGYRVIAREALASVPLEQYTHVIV
jgi:lysophospholipase L1-like esterase